MLDGERSASQTGTFKTPPLRGRRFLSCESGNKFDLGGFYSREASRKGFVYGELFAITWPGIDTAQSKSSAKCGADIVKGPESNYHEENAMSSMAGAPTLVTSQVRTESARKKPRSWPN